MPISKFFPQAPADVGNERLWHIFDGEPVASYGFIDFDHARSGFGLTLSVGTHLGGV